MATRKGLEPSTSGVTGRRSNQLNYHATWYGVNLFVRRKCGDPFLILIKNGGNNRARTCDIMLVRHALYQLSYAPLSAALSHAAKVIILKPRPDVNTKLPSFSFLLI
ncbi:conserved hypothetical protein [uncultured Eubacteriales bacterium]|uniref:Uncharacterized protein n=1 Tax=uncultured Eubacteriales bacterium TaxID=172733 RepID=A0A212JHU6_9FIRM|nr:conserved hypothetical protein [uncultured Eubacteriales bacterium]